MHNHYDPTNEDDLMQPALEAARIGALLRNYHIGAALFSSNGELIATAYGAGITAGEIFHAETQLAILLRSGRSAGIFSQDERYIMTTTLQPCPQCRQICIQQQKLSVLYGASTPTSGANLGDLLETYTNTEKLRISENSGEQVVREAQLSKATRDQCIQGHKQYRSKVLKSANEVSAELMPFTDLLELVRPTNPTIIPKIRSYQSNVRARLEQPHPFQQNNDTKIP
ncbi:MAG: hypothetical protein CL789_01700 [Chloroflexi bacterium]|nr:hypothetical protein [Chloroflexota bacterium]HCU81109.1 hypothetical protein [Chloroflexota bacterium]|tara:strand:- start:40 stop:720 length:681 start_codon:yes stop_codon:yes gene_type:complete